VLVISRKSSKLKNLIFLLLVTISLAGCKSFSVFDKKTDKISENTREENAQITSNYIEAKRLFLKGNILDAEKLFKKCIELNPQHSASMFELSKLYHLLGENENSIAFIKKSVELNPENIWYQKQAAHIFQKNKMYDEASNHLKEIIEMQADEKQNYYNLANNFIYADDYKSALKVYDEILEKFGYEEGIILQKKQIYLKNGQYSKALNEIEDLIIRYPENTDYYGMAADIHKHQGDEEKALEMYKKILEIEPSNGKVHLALADYYAKKGDAEKAFDEIKIAFESSDVDIDRKIKILMKLYKELDDNEVAAQDASILLELLEKANTEEAKAMSIIADFLVKDKKLSEAAKYYEKAVKLDMSNYLLWEQLILIYNELRDYDKMKQRSDDALKLFPQNAALYYYNAIAAYRLKEYKQAIKQINIGLNFTYKDMHFIDFYNLLAEVHQADNDFENAYYHYQKTLSVDKNNVEALSNYALLLAKNNSELNKAENMAKRALELNPDTSFSAFVYAKVKFVIGENDKAKIWIDKALEVDKLAKYYDLAILIEEALGNQDKALEYKLLLKDL
jgi:tetratricopeptide (TPR) repeat protein